MRYVSAARMTASGRLQAFTVTLVRGGASKGAELDEFSLCDLGRTPSQGCNLQIELRAAHFTIRLRAQGRAGFRGLIRGYGAEIPRFTEGDLDGNTVRRYPFGFR